MSEYERKHGHPRSRWNRLTRQHYCYSYSDCTESLAGPVVICTESLAGPVVILAAIVGVVAFVFALVTGGFAIDRHFSEKGCVGYGEQTDRDVRWVDASFFDYGCYVNWNDTWIPRDDYMRITFGHETGVES